MKKIYLTILFMGLFVLVIRAQNIWTNEFHYDNVSTDENEFIEVVLEDAGSYSLSDFAVTLYNGNNGESYDTKTLDQFTMGDVEGDFTIYYYDYPSNGIQNGESDGIALSYQDVLIAGQFISYEGTLTAIGGPADGETSVDIGVSESGVESDQSLQLSGTGDQYAAFTWQEPALNTKGQLNNNQTFGGYTPDPEPSNYPTAFAGAAQGMKINLTWTDATGEQLPAAYIVYGTTGDTFPVPEDGTPVTDDTDFSDGEVALNVPFGDEGCSFNVDPNTSYSFTIYPYTNAGEYIDFKTDETAPVTDVMSANYIVVSSEEFSNALNTWSWTPYDVNGDEEWVWEENYGNPPGSAKMSGHTDANYPNEDWLISPELDLHSYMEVFFSFDHARNFATNDGLSVLVSSDYDGTSDPSVNGTWIDITNMFTFPENGTWVFSPAGEAEVVEHSGANTYFAFRYISTVEDAATWEVDNALVYGIISVGVEEIMKENISVYPNPATDRLNIVCPLQGQLRITNITGQVVLQKALNSGVNTVNVSAFEPGLYVVQFTGEEGNTSTQKLMIR
ncbi:MAG: hypothetical protein DRI88_00930 [Bacteroidetes bacterium]|nr:MAG: hypothetical protein DRI88_00930 [Bacteroidota bacterium]RLD74053.1 MAG: hypothetical protein DRI87_02210 [Bacteroidota bacterium]RLD89555.1 MAG: hypothetical protein DRJ02_01145 [Bacteroidota bacterium]